MSVVEMNAATANGYGYLAQAYSSRRHTQSSCIDSSEWQIHLCRDIRLEADVERQRAFASQPQLPDLPLLPQGGEPSDELEEEKDAKRPRSRSTIPRSGKGLEPYEYDRLMGVHSVGSSSEDIGEKH